MDDGVGGGGDDGVELLTVSKFNTGVDRVRNADNEDKSSLLCVRIFELNFVPLPPPTGLLTAVRVFVFVLPVVVMDDVASTTRAVAVSVLISSVAAESYSNSVFNSRLATVAVVDADFCCNDGNSIFKLFGRSNFLCLYTAGRSVDRDESVDADADADDDDDDDMDMEMDVVVIGMEEGAGGACIIFFGVLKLLKRFMPDAGNAADGGGDEMVDFLAFSNALKCSG